MSILNSSFKIMDSEEAEDTGQTPGTSKGTVDTDTKHMLVNLLASLQRAQKEKGVMHEKYTKALKKGVAADDDDYIACLNHAKKKFDANPTLQVKNRLLKIIGDAPTPKKTGYDPAFNLRVMLNSVANKEEAPATTSKSEKKTSNSKQTSDNKQSPNQCKTAEKKPKDSKKPTADKKSTAQNTSNESKKRKADPSKSQTPPPKKVKCETSPSVPSVSKNTAKSNEKEKQKAGPSKQKTDKQEKSRSTRSSNKEEEESDGSSTLVTKKVRTKIEKSVYSMCEHFAAAIGKELVEDYEADDPEDMDKTEILTELSDENRLRAEMNLPLLKAKKPHTKEVFVLPEIDGMTLSESYIIKQLSDLSTTAKELAADVTDMKQTLNSICAAQVQQHQYLRFIRLAVGGDKLDSAAKDVLKRCGQIIELRSNPYLKGVPFDSTLAICEFFLCPKRVVELAVYILTYADYNHHFSGHLVQLAIAPNYKETVWWCNSTLE